MKSFFLLAAFGLFLSGCASEGGFNWSTHTWNTNHGAYALDHINQHKVETSKAMKRTFLGETYYFENEQNAKAFDANPWSYLYTDNMDDSDRPDRTDWN